MLNNTPYNVQLTLQFNEHLQYTLHLLVSIASLCSNPAIWQVVEHIGTEDNGLNSNTQVIFNFNKRRLVDIRGISFLSINSVSCSNTVTEG